MGAAQIGGVATLLDIDFNNAAGFKGEKADTVEAQYYVYFLSHAMIFCAGALIESHVVLTPAVCVYGEKYKFDIFAGSHMFLEDSGISRSATSLCVHKSYSTNQNESACFHDNLALVVLSEGFQLKGMEPGAHYPINRIRYGTLSPQDRAVDIVKQPVTCKIFGYGSRRNGYLVPLLLHMYRFEMTLANETECDPVWRHDDGRFHCLKHTAVCTDDLGTILECNGFAEGMMVSRLVDRPCGVGYLNLNRYIKFLTCGVDDSRDVIDDSGGLLVDFTTLPIPLSTTLPNESEEEEVQTPITTSTNTTTDQNHKPRPDDQDNVNNFSR